MTRDEATKRFNALPKEHRVTIIASELEQEIRWLEREKRKYKADYLNDMRIINGRIKDLERNLRDLKD
jgi:hypothetical protein